MGSVFALCPSAVSAALVFVTHRSPQSLHSASRSMQEVKRVAHVLISVERSCLSALFQPSHQHTPSQAYTHSINLAAYALHGGWPWACQVFRRQPPVQGQGGPHTLLALDVKGRASAVVPCGQPHTLPGFSTLRPWNKFLCVHLRSWCLFMQRCSVFAGLMATETVQQVHAHG